MSEVRRVTPQEWATLRSIRLAALRDAPRSFGSAYEREAAWDEARWRESARTVAWFLAWRDGLPVGVAGGHGGAVTDTGAPGEQRDGEGASAAEAGDERRLISMWVEPAARGTGIADALIGTVAGWARADGARTLKLWVADASPRARAFYERAGFRPTGATDEMPGDPGAKQQELRLDLYA